MAEAGGRGQSPRLHLVRRGEQLRAVGGAEGVDRQDALATFKADLDMQVT